MYLQNFRQNDFTRINFDQFIHGPIIDSFCQSASREKDKTITKFDINSAYISFFSREIILPTSKVVYNLFGFSAIEAFMNIDNNNEDLFYWIKIKITSCSLSENQKLYLGKNTETIHGFLEDIKYIQKLKISFEVIQIIAVQGVYNTQFQLFSKKLMHLKSQGGMFKDICKSLALFGLGQIATKIFVLNISIEGSWDTERVAKF